MKDVLSNAALNKVMNIMKGGLNSKESLMETNNDTEIVKDLWHEGEEYTVRFHDASNEIIDEQIVVYGNSAIIPSSNPIKDPTVSVVYTFSHWDKDTSIVTGNIDLYPVFTESPRLYNVRFYNYDNSLLSSQNIPYNQSASMPADPRKPKDTHFYTFNRWDKDTSVITSDLDVHAVFTRDEYQIAPEGELNKWEYTIEGNNVLLSSLKYDPINSEGYDDIIVYDKYTKDGVQYNTKINNTNVHGMLLCSSKNNTVTKTFTIGNYVDDSLITNANSMLSLSWCPKIHTIDLGKGLSLRNSTSFGYFLNGSLSLISPEREDVLDLDNIDDVIKLVYENNPDTFVTKLKEIKGLENIDTSNATSMFCTFGNHLYLSEIKGIENWDTSNVTSMISLFQWCFSLRSLNLSNWNVSNVEFFSLIFLYDMFLESLDLSNWDTRKGIYMDNMFSGCKSLTSLDLTSFDVSNAEIIISMFRECRSLKEIKGIENWNVAKPASINGLSNMFYGCRSLESLDLTSWDIRNAKKLTKMFYGCTNLKEILVSRDKWVIPSGCDTTDMFTGCGVDHVTYVD